MTDYHSPTVVQPNIPATDMTPLEWVILDLVFDAENEDDGIYYHSWCGPSDIITLSVYDLRIASDASCGAGESSIGTHVAKLLARHDAESFDDPPDDLDVDLTDSDSAGIRSFRISCAARPRSMSSWLRLRSPARKCDRTVLAAA